MAGARAGRPEAPVGREQAVDLVSGLIEGARRVDLEGDLVERAAHVGEGREGVAMHEDHGVVGGVRGEGAWREAEDVLGSDGQADDHEVPQLPFEHHVEPVPGAKPVGFGEGL